MKNLVSNRFSMSTSDIFYSRKNKYFTNTVITIFIFILQCDTQAIKSSRNKQSHCSHQGLIVKFSETLESEWGKNGRRILSCVQLVALNEGTPGVGQGVTTRQYLPFQPQPSGRCNCTACSDTVLRTSPFTQVQYWKL